MANPQPLPKASFVAVALCVCCLVVIVLPAPPCPCPARVSVDTGGAPLPPVTAAVVAMVTPGVAVPLSGPLVDLGVARLGARVVKRGLVLALGSVLMDVCAGGAAAVVFTAGIFLQSSV